MVMPISHGNGTDSMFPPELFDFESFANKCHKMYGVQPQPHWVTTNYGGHVCCYSLCPSLYLSVIVLHYLSGYFISSGF